MNLDLPYITLISFGYFDADFLRNVAEAVKKEFLLNVNIKEGHLDLSEFYDPTRRQYNGVRLVNEIENIYSSDSSKTIGIIQCGYFHSYPYIYFRPGISEWPHRDSLQLPSQ